MLDPKKHHQKSRGFTEVSAVTEKSAAGSADAESESDESEEVKFAAGAENVSMG